MTSQYRHRRTSNPATPAPTLEPGEIAVNTANRQLHLGDAASGTLGTPKPLLPIRFFDTAAMYAIGDLIVQAGKGYRALVANGPGAFNVAQWELSGTQLLVSPTAPVGVSDGTLWWDSSTDSGQLYVLYNDGNTTQWVIAVPQPSVNQFVQKAGDTMTGDLAIQKAGYPKLTFNATDQTTGLIVGTRNNVNRWAMYFGDANPETGSNAGSDFQLQSYTDAGGVIESPIIVRRSDGYVSVKEPTQGHKTTTVATTNFVKVWAAPFDALAYNGMQVNGGFDVNQAAIASTPVGFFCDNWTASKNGTMVIVASAGGTGGFAAPNVGVVQVTTAQASLAAGDYTCIGTVIEGYRMARLGWGTPYAQPITVGFSSCHHRPGTYSVRFNNIGGSRSYTATYTQNSADTWEWKTITIPGDTTGTWDKTNGTGTNLSFVMACGSTYTSPANGVWTAGNFLAGPGQINGVAATSDVFRITNVVVLPGTEAPPEAKAPLIMRPYDQELLTCRRYFWRFNALTSNNSFCNAMAFNGTIALGNLRFPVLMRAPPTFTYGPAVADFTLLTAAGMLTPVSITTDGTGVDGVSINPNVATGLASGQACYLRAATANAYMAFDARL